MNTMQRLLEFITEKTNTLSGITIGSAVTGTTVGAVEQEVVKTAPAFFQTDLLSLLQYSAYFVSIVVGVLTIISWCRKNKRKLT